MTIFNNNRSRSIILNLKLIDFGYSVRKAYLSYLNLQNFYKPCFFSIILVFDDSWWFSSLWPCKPSTFLIFSIIVFSLYQDSKIISKNYVVKRRNLLFQHFLIFDSISVTFYFYDQLKQNIELFLVQLRYFLLIDHNILTLLIIKDCLHF